MDLAQAHTIIQAVEDSEQDLKERLAAEKHKTVALEKTLTDKAVFGSINCTDALALVKRYGELYSQLRLETLDALDRMPELVNSEELKNKLLFSVVVVSI